MRRRPGPQGSFTWNSRAGTVADVLVMHAGAVPYSLPVPQLHNQRGARCHERTPLPGLSDPAGCTGLTSCCSTRYTGSWTYGHAPRSLLSVPAIDHVCHTSTSCRARCRPAGRSSSSHPVRACRSSTRPGHRHRPAVEPCDGTGCEESRRICRGTDARGSQRTCRRSAVRFRP